MRDGNKETGNKQQKSKFYEKVNEIISDKPSISPPVLLDTSAVNKEQNDDIVDEVPETNVEDEAEKSAVNEDNVATAVNKSEVKETGNEYVKPQVGTKRKRHVKVDKMEKVIDKMCEKLSSQQSESDLLNLKSSV